MSSDEKVLVVVELDRDLAGSVTRLSGVHTDAIEQFENAIRAALARKEEPWVGYSHPDDRGEEECRHVIENMTDYARDWRPNGWQRVLVVSLPEEDAK